MVIFYFFFTECTVTSKRWIICLKDSDQKAEFVITDNLAKLNMNVFDKISDKDMVERELYYGIKKYDDQKDPCGILCPNEQNHYVSVERRLSSADDDETFRKQNRLTYYRIFIPISKALFLKAIDLTLCSKIKFTAYEIYDILENLVVFLKDKFYVSYVIYKNMRSNSLLLDQLMHIYNETAQIKEDNSDVPIPLMLSSLMIELANRVALIIVDNFGNITVASINENNRDRIHISIGLEKMGFLFPIHYLTADTEFIMQNDKFLHGLYYNLNNGEKLTVNISFQSVVHAKKDVPISSTMMYKLKELSYSIFLQLRYIKTTCLHFSHVVIDFDLNFLAEKEINLNCNNCTILHGIMLPEHCKQIMLEYCHIKTSLVLSSNLTMVIFRHVEVSENVIVDVDSNIKHLELINIVGKVNILQIKKNFFGFKCKKNWSFKLEKEKHNIIKELLIENIMFEDAKIVFSQETRKLSLRNICCESQTTIAIYNKVETVYIDRITATVHIYDSMVHHDMLAVILNNGSLFIQESTAIQDKNSKKDVKRRKTLQISNASIMNDIIFSSDLFTLILNNVMVCNDKKLLNLENTIFELYIKNCDGDVSFNNIAGFNKVCFRKDVENEQLFSFIRLYSLKKVIIDIRNIAFYDNVILSQDVDEIVLVKVAFLENNILSICDGYGKLAMFNCVGTYHIPNVLYNGETAIVMPECHNLIISSNEMNSYNVQIKNMLVERPWLFDLDIDSMEMCNLSCDNVLGSLKFTKSCKKLDLTNVSCMLDFPNVKSFDKVVLQDITHRNVTNVIFSIPARHIELVKVNIDIDLVLWNQTKHVRIEHVNDGHFVDTVLNPKTILLNKNNKNVCASDSDVLVNLSDILKYSRNNDKVFAIKPSYFRLTTINSACFRHIELINFYTDGNWQLTKKIESLELEKIFSIKTSYKFIIMHELDNISINNCCIDVSLSYPHKLKKMSIIQSKMCYNPDVHVLVRCISLIHLKIDETLVLLDNVESIYIENVKIKQDKEIVLGKNISFLRISRVTGLINMAATVINHTFELKGKEIIQFERQMPENSEFSLFMHNVCFSSNYQFAQNIMKIRLEYVLANNCMIEILNCCNVEIVGCKLVTKLFESHSELKYFVQNYDASIKGLIVLLKVNALRLQDIKLTTNIALSSYVKIVTLKKVELPDSMQFIVNQKCEEFSLISCKGLFNLKKVTKLRKLVFVSPMDACTLLTHKKCLHYLHELKIGGYVDDNYIISIVSQCNHLKKLTLQSPMLSYKAGVDIIHIFGRETMSFSNDSHVDLLSRIFNFNMVNKLEYLDVSMLFFDHSKTTIWKEFSKLQTLVVNFSAISQMLLENIPSSIKIFKCMQNYSTNLVHDSGTSWKNYFENLKNHKNIKNLTIQNILCNGYNILLYLPSYLEKLTVTTFNMPCCSAKQTNVSKSYVVELVLYAIVDEDNSKMTQRNFSKRYYENVFDYLQNFVDFDTLENLVLETKTTKIYLNTKTYQIK